MNELGRSFLPGADDDQSGPNGARLEDVLRVLSFRLPRILGARPIAPAQLLNNQGSAGDPLASSVVQGIMSRLGGPSMPGSGGADAGAPSPLSQLFAPLFGAGGISGPADLPAQSGPRIIPIENPPSGNRGGTATGPGSGMRFEDQFSDVGDQLTRGARRIS